MVSYASNTYSIDLTKNSRTIWKSRDPPSVNGQKQNTQASQSTNAFPLMLMLKIPREKQQFSIVFDRDSLTPVADRATVLKMFLKRIQMYMRKRYEDHLSMQTGQKLKPCKTLPPTRWSKLILFNFLRFC